MSANLVETIQKNLGYPPLKKIDPNTDEVRSSTNEFNEYDLGQAAIPAILISMCSYTQTDDGAKDVLCGDTSSHWLNKLLGENANEEIEKIAVYAYTTKEIALEKMKVIAAEAVKVIRSTNPLTLNDVKALLANEKNNILLYLPPALKIGGFLNDKAIDDNTHKMEGPVSSFMNAIGNLFSGGGEKEEDKF